MKKLLFAAVIFFLSLNCVSCGSQPDPAEIDTQPPDDTNAKSAEFSEEEAASDEAAEPPEISDKPLSEDAPWLIIDSWQGLFALNPDGSGLTQFVDKAIESPYTGQFTASRLGGHFAFHESGGDTLDAAINIISLPTFDLTAEIPLFPNGDPGMEAKRAVLDNQSMAFSPDGRQLAFMGIINDPTSDLYVYSLDTGKLVQLTNGRTQGYQPSWSPDGKYILHTGADAFGTGAGFSTKGIWTAQADRDNVQSLYTPEPNIAEMILGWVDDDTFVVYSWSQPCGPFNLRTFNIENGQRATLWPDPFNDIAFDPDSNTILLTSWDGDMCAPEEGAGTYLISAVDGEVMKVADDIGVSVVWSQTGQSFLVYGGTPEEWMLGVDTRGNVLGIDRPTEAMNQPVLSPDGIILVWAGGPPHISSTDSTIPLRGLLDESIHQALWTPDGQAVIFVTKSGLYIAQQPDFIPVLISSEIQLQKFDDYMEWIFP